MVNDDSVQNLKAQIKDLELRLNQLKQKYELQEAKAKDFQNEFVSMQAELFNYYRYSNELQKLCDDLKKELGEVYSSSRWKITEPIWSLKNRLMPSKIKAESQTGDKQNCDAAETPLQFDKAKKNILVLDRCILRPDRDAGSLSTFQYLKLIVEMGFHVYFFGDDFGDLYAKDTKGYIDQLNELGVKVLFGEYYTANYSKWLSLYGDYFDYVLINRPNIASKYIDLIKQYSKAKIVYIGQDLHFLRESREYELTGDPMVLKNTGVLKNKEFWVMSESDVTLMFSYAEQAAIEKEFGIKNVIVSPLTYFEDLKYKHRNFDKTEDLLFVGGFSHKPNVDAVKWFLSDIWPQIKDRINAKVYFVGSNLPYEIKNMETERIIFTGFLPSDELDALYKSCRLCIIPLRFGAGIKGKTLEAMKNGIPLVTTSIGIEGLPGIKKIITPADNSVEFGEQIIKKYSDFANCQTESEKYIAYLKKEFSKEKLIKILSDILN